MHSFKSSIQVRNCNWTGLKNNKVGYVLMIIVLALVLAYYDISNTYIISFIEPLRVH